MSIAIFPPDPEVEKRERLRAIAYGHTEADADMTARVYDGPTDWVGRPATEAGVQA